jgi:hypothetical protein
MSKSYLNRREFIKLSSAVAATAIIGVSCDGGGSTETNASGTVKVYRLSLRGRRGSNAAKIHNNNKLFLTPEAADMNKAYPRDNSRIVSEILSESGFNELFKGVTLEVVDLRG